MREIEREWVLKKESDELEDRESTCNRGAYTYATVAGDRGAGTVTPL
jgi:hypothetical protein